MSADPARPVTMKEGLGTEPRQDEEDLKPEHHAGEGAGQDHDGERAEADEVDALHQAGELEGRDEDVGNRLDEEATEAAEGLQHLEGSGPELSDQADGQDLGRRGGDRPRHPHAVR